MEQYEAMNLENRRMSDSRRMEEQRMADERRYAEFQAQERRRKESEHKAAEKKKSYPIVGRGNDIVTQSARLTEQSIRMLYDDTKNIIRMSRELLQKRAEKKLLTENDCNKIIKTYESLKECVARLDITNRKLAQNPKGAMHEKCIENKRALEKQICVALDIKKDKPSLFHGKQAVEKSFKGKIDKGMKVWAEKADFAQKHLKELKAARKVEAVSKPVNRGNRTASKRECVTTHKVKIR